MYVDVSNILALLDISYSKVGEDLVIDTPGVYGISSFNDEERIARDVILNADIVVNIVDAVHLERDLFLTQQIIDTGVPMVVALNMVDEAKSQGIKVDRDLLEPLLGVPVVETIAIAKKGMDELKSTINNAQTGTISHNNLKDKLVRMKAQVACQGEALLILEGDPVLPKNMV